MIALTIFAGLNPVVAIIGGGLLAAALSVPIATLIFRLKGAYFAIGTWVVAEVFRLSFAQIQALGGGSGSSLPVAMFFGFHHSKPKRQMSLGNYQWIDPDSESREVGKAPGFCSGRRRFLSRCQSCSGQGWQIHRQLKRLSQVPTQSTPRRRRWHK